MSTTIAELPAAQQKKTDENLAKSKRLHKFAGGVTRRVRCHAFTKHYSIVDQILPGNTSRIFRKLAEVVDLNTRTTVMGMEDWAKRAGVHLTTIQRHKKLIVAAGLIRVDSRHDENPRRKGKSRLTDRITILPIEEVFQRHNRGGGGSKIAGASTNYEIKKLTTTTTPLPPKGGGEVSLIERVEPQRPKPSAEVHAALQQARELRSQRKAERRAVRHERARESKHEPSPVQRVVRHIMAALRVCPSLWATRSAIQFSVERWMKTEQVGAEAAANALVGRWLGYAAMSRNLEYPCGMRTWFGDCRWADVKPSETRQLRSRFEVTVGTYRPPVVVDMVALREKMKALLGDFDEGSARE